jgi:hypothetical protein
MLTARYRISSVMVLCILSLLRCEIGSRCFAQDSAKQRNLWKIRGDSVFASNKFGYMILAPKGCYFAAHSWDESAPVVRAGRPIFFVDVDVAKGYHLSNAQATMPLDLFKGYSMSRQQTGPSLGEPDDCWSRTRVDSIYEFRNQSGLRCLRLNSTYTSYCEKGDSTVIHWEQYFVDISQGPELVVICTEHLFETQDLGALCSELIWSIRRIPREH